MADEDQVTCITCGGSGFSNDRRERCRLCEGTGQISRATADAVRTLTRYTRTLVSGIFLAVLLGVGGGVHFQGSTSSPDLIRLLFGVLIGAFPGVCISIIAFALERRYRRRNARARNL
jgi:hypothetical protein